MLAIKNYLFIFLVLAVLPVSLIPSVYAHCPLCTAAVGAAAVSAKYYGLDASIIGLLIGAFAISTGLWIAIKIKKKYFKIQSALIVLSSFLLTVIPLSGIIDDSAYVPMLLFGASGSLLNKAYWINKILLGSLVGALLTIAAFWLHTCIKKINGKVLFPFQGIAITLAFLAVSGISLYFAFR